jgi:hypothetical protein
MRRHITTLCCVLTLAALAGCADSEVPVGPSAPAVPSPARVVGLRVTGQSNFFQRGETVQLTAAATLSNGFTENRTASSQWQSSNNAVASVSGAGVLTIGDEGEATITASHEGQQATMGVRVRYAFRAPDPPAGQRLPKPDVAGFVADLINSRPDLVARSCQDQGGTWELLDFIVDELRSKRDLRWGYNGRRGDINFVARDEIAYHAGAGASENSRETYAWDILGGHCGPNPIPVWIDMSDLGTIWLTRGRF